MAWKLVIASEVQARNISPDVHLLVGQGDVKMIEPCIGCDNIICICSPEEIEWALKNLWQDCKLSDFCILHDGHTGDCKS